MYRKPLEWVTRELIEAMEDIEEEQKRNKRKGR
jgi:hypothetical protein